MNKVARALCESGAEKRFDICAQSSGEVLAFRATSEICQRVTMIPAHWCDEMSVGDAKRCYWIEPACAIVRVQ